MSKTATEPETTQEHKLADGCDRRHCTREVFRGALVPIWVGDVEQHWCPQCVKDETGLDYADYQNRSRDPGYYVTKATVAAFGLGVLLTWVVASIAVV